MSRKGEDYAGERVETRSFFKEKRAKGERRGPGERQELSHVARS